MRAPKVRLQSDNVIAETLLIPLYARALEGRRPVPLLRDDMAAALVESIDQDFTRFRLSRLDHVTIVMRAREFDRRARGFLAQHPQATVVHIGCGLDTRFERVRREAPAGQAVTWFDLDLPEVIALRRRLIPEGDRRRYLGASVFDSTWLDDVGANAERPILFLAEGVFPYFEESQVKALFLAFLARFPGSELVCDAMTPLMVRMNNLQLRFDNVCARLHWGLPHARDVERWGEGIRVLDEWFYFDRPEPRLGAARLMRYLPGLAKGAGIYHYRLGKAGGD